MRVAPFLSHKCSFAANTTLRYSFIFHDMAPLANMNTMSNLEQDDCTYPPQIEFVYPLRRETEYTDIL